MVQVANKSAVTTRKGRKSADPTDVLVFLIPCLQFIRINLVGVLNGADVMFLLTFIYLAFRGRIRIASRTGKTFVVLCSLWLLSQCVTDFVRHTAFADYARGWSNIGFTIVNFAAICTLLYGRPRRIVLYGWGLVAGELLRYWISPDVTAADHPWKFGFSYPVTLAVFLVASRKECRGHWPITLSAIIGVVNVFLGARSSGGLCLAAAVYLLVTRYLSRTTTASHKLKASTVALIAASLLAGVVGIFWTYQYAATSGILGEEARAKYEEQSSGKYGVLLGGRAELLASIPAVYNSPILGHGSWARDPTYIIIQRQALVMLGYSADAIDVDPDEIAEGLIPAHSYLFQAWVDAGVLGAVFWACVWVMVLRVLMRTYPPGIVLPAAVPWMAFGLLWAILFSPYGATERIIAPYYIVIFMGYRNIASRKAAEAATGKAIGRLKIA